MTSPITAFHAGLPGWIGPRRRLLRPRIVGLGVAAALVVASTAAANDWIEVFQARAVAPISIGASELVALPDLDEYGTLDVEGDPDLRTVADAEVAAARTGLAVPRVAVPPDGVSGDPTYQTAGRVAATYVFDTDQTGLPSEVAGSSLRLEAGPAVAAVWTSESGLPALVVARAVAPTVSSSGASFEMIRDALVSLPGVSDRLAAQLESLDADGSTLPLIGPDEHVASSTADVGGVPATVLETRDRSMAAVVWIDDGIVTAVGGSLDADQVLAIAQSLQ